MFEELFWLIKKAFGKVKESNYLTYKEMKYFPFKGYKAMCWCGYIIMRSSGKISNRTLIHESIHLRQACTKYKGKRWIRYYLNYFWWYLKGNPIFNHKRAYYINPYEMEAYANEYKSLYINKVNKDSYKKYIFKDIKSIYRKNKNNWKNFLRSI